MSTGTGALATLSPQRPVEPERRVVDDPRFDLWSRFWATRDLPSRNLLLLAYEPVVDAVIARLPMSVRANAAPEDLHSFGLFGLVDAIDKCDEHSDTARFPAYASYRIRGAIVDELRRLDWLPRSTRLRMIAYRSTVDELSSELGRVPERGEVFASMGLDADAGFSLLQDVDSAQLAHLEHGSNESGRTTVHPLIDRVRSSPEGEPEHELLAAERLSELRAALMELPERQRTVISLRYGSGRTQGQVASSLGVTTPRVCQIESAAIRNLRRILTEAGSPEAGETGAVPPDHQRRHGAQLHARTGAAGRRPRVPGSPRDPRAAWVPPTPELAAESRRHARSAGVASA